MLNVKIEGELAAAIEKEARRGKVTRPAFVRSVVAQYFDYQNWKERKIKKGLADIDAGRTISHAALVASLKRQRARRARKTAA